MAARKKSKSSLYLYILLAVLAVLLIVYVAMSKTGGFGKVTPTPSPKPTAVTVPVGAVSGSIGRNLLTATSGPKSGEVTLSWTRYYSDHGMYSILYRVNPGKYAYGVLNAVNSVSTSNTFSYVVSSLKPGTKYYFALEIPQTNSKVVYVTPEVSVVAP
jgi:hypothetical protein